MQNYSGCQLLCLCLCVCVCITFTCLSEMELGCWKWNCGRGNIKNKVMVWGWTQVESTLEKLGPIVHSLSISEDVLVLPLVLCLNIGLDSPERITVSFKAQWLRPSSPFAHVSSVPKMLAWLLKCFDCISSFLWLVETVNNIPLFRLCGDGTLVSRLQWEEVKGDKHNSESSATRKNLMGYYFFSSSKR